MRRSIAFAVAGILGLCGVVSRPAQAQSFDCAKARAPHELLICASPTMRALDSELGAAYTAALARLSESARLDVRRAQREWLAYWPTSCRDGRAPLNPRSKKAQECAAERYRHRLDRLRGDTLISRDIRLYQSSRYLIERSTAGSEYYAFAYATLTGFRVDLAAVPSNRQALASAIDRWLYDSLARNFGLDTESDIEGIVSFQPTLPFLLTTLTNESYTNHNGARPGWGLTFRHFHLVAGRPMLVTDIFGTSGWQDPLATWVERGLKKEMGADFPEIDADARRGLQEQVVDPIRWTFDGKGLTVNPLDRYELLYSNTGVTVPWSVLAPWLTEPVRRSVLR